MIFNKPNGRELWTGILAAAIVLLADVLISTSHGAQSTGEHGHEGFLGKIPFLSAWLGLVGAFVLVLIAKTVGRLFLQRKDDPDA